MTKPVIFAVSAIWDAEADVWSGQCDERSGGDIFAPEGWNRERRKITIGQGERGVGGVAVRIGVSY
jgi:hypothetical protein